MSEALTFFAVAPELVPTKAHPTDGGYDLRVNDGSVHLPPGKAVVVHTGVHVAIPKGYVGLAISRSGLGKPEVNVALSNAVGVIDADYRGEIMLILHNKGTQTQNYSRLDRVAQLVVVPIFNGITKTVNSLDKLDETVRGTKGFGSTGKK